MIKHSYEYESCITDMFGRQKMEEVTFIENKNSDELTKEIIKNCFLGMEMLALQSYYSAIVGNKVCSLCEKLNKKFPQADFEWDYGNWGILDFTIIAKIKPYKNLTEKRIEKICEMTNTTTDYDGEGQIVYFYFDKEGFLERKYNGADRNVVNEVAVKHGLPKLVVE